MNAIIGDVSDSVPQQQQQQHNNSGGGFHSSGGSNQNSPPQPQHQQYHAFNSFNPQQHGGGVPQVAMPYSSTYSTSFTGGEVPVLSVDVAIQKTPGKEGLGFQPLRYSLHELSKALLDKKHFHDGAEWLRRFWFASGQGGLPVLKVEVGGPAEAAGLRVCDVIVSINGKDCREWSQKKCASTIRDSLVKSTTIVLSVVRCTQLPYDTQTCMLFADQARQAKAQNFSVTVRIPILAENTAFGFTPLKYSFSDTDLPRSERCMVQEIRRKLPFAIGGLPVQSVDPDGPAAQAGLQAWDVIAEVNGTDVQNKTAAAITQLIRTALVPLNLARKSDEVLELRVVRSATPIVTTTPKSTAVQRAIFGLHWLSSPGKTKSNTCPAFGTRASEVDTGDIVVAEVDTFSYGS